MESIQLHNLSVSEFRNILAEEIHNQLKFHNGDSPNSDELIPRLEVAKKLGITPTTLYSWTIKGLLTSYKVGGKVFYRHSELIQCIKKQKQKNLQYKR